MVNHCFIHSFYSWPMLDSLSYEITMSTINKKNIMETCLWSQIFLSQPNGKMSYVAASASSLE